MGAAATSKRFARCPRLELGAPGGETLEVAVAIGLRVRLLGLARLASSRQPALLIPRCRAVHGHGMRSDLDVCFLAMPAAGGPTTEVLAVTAPMRRGGSASIPRALRGDLPARRIAALELPPGAADRLGIEPGTALTIGHIGCSRT